eukprot:c21076_g4_i1 orf=1-240(+)
MLSAGSADHGQGCYGCVLLANLLVDTPLQLSQRSAIYLLGLVPHSIIHSTCRWDCRGICYDFFFKEICYDFENTLRSGD